MNNKEKSFNKAEYDNNFQKENYDRIVIKVKKGKKKEPVDEIVQILLSLTTD